VDLDFIIGLIKRKDEFVIVNNRNEDITNQVILKLLRRELRENARKESKKEVI
jgi:predicted nuclease of predicted toxin-antitoxin system